MRSRFRRVLAASLVAAACLVAVSAVVSLSHPIDRSVADATSGTSRGATSSADVVREKFRLDDAGGSFMPNARNYASRTGSASPLLLFLPATRERPSNYTEFLATAREHGYHVLALDYWNNGESVQKTCGTDADCYADVQRNRLDGSHPTRFSAVDPRNSIENRLRMAIGHLETSDPQGGWGRFAAGRTIDWRDIVVSGHSQGGGESAYIAHLHSVRGVLMFSSPVDSDQGVDAAWMAQPGATPASRMYGFDDTGDIFGSRIVASWNALGMNAFGPAMNVDSGLSGSSHELVSTRHLGTALQSHSFDITDRTPREPGGAPVYKNVWSWMLDHAWKSKPIANS